MTSAWHQQLKVCLLLCSVLREPPADQQSLIPPADLQLSLRHFLQPLIQPQLLPPTHLSAGPQPLLAAIQPPCAIVGLQGDSRLCPAAQQQRGRRPQQPPESQPSQQPAACCQPDPQGPQPRQARLRGVGPQGGSAVSPPQPEVNQPASDSAASEHEAAGSTHILTLSHTLSHTLPPASVPALPSAGNRSEDSVGKPLGPVCVCVCLSV